MNWINTIMNTLVIGINMHGEIPLQENGKVYTDTIPNNMNISIISSVAPGIPFVSTLSNSENLLNKIPTKLKQVKDWNKLTNSQLTKITKHIRNLLVDTNIKEANNIVKESQHLYVRNKTNTIYQKFSQYYDNSFKVTSYCGGDVFTDKLFIKFLDGEVLNPFNITENYFNKLTILNSNEQQDIFQMLKICGLNIEQIWLSELFEFLLNIGVENLIIIDLSCSIFTGDPKYLTDRHIRYLRREMIK